MARIDDLVEQALRSLGNKPPDTAKRTEKQYFSQRLSEALAQAFAEELRSRGLEGTRPAPPGEIDAASGTERRMSGGIGAKKVDVTWATEESGLLFAISIKSINFRDQRSGNFQKNLTNRRGDMLFESVTLHRRFPYSVLAGFLILDREAAQDATNRRESTFMNAHHRLRLFTGRTGPGSPDEQYERLYVVLHEASAFKPEFDAYPVGQTDASTRLEMIFDDLVELVAQRNPDFYEAENGLLKKA